MSEKGKMSGLEAEQVSGGVSGRTLEEYSKHHSSTGKCMYCGKVLYKSSDGDDELMGGFSDRICADCIKFRN